MSYLDDPRVFFAAERTMLAWQRTAIALIGLGFVIERFGLFMQMIAAGGGPQATAPETSVVISLALLVGGAAIAIVSAVQFRRFVVELSPLEVPARYVVWLGPMVNFLLAGVAAGLAGWIVLGHWRAGAV